MREQITDQRRIAVDLLYLDLSHCTRCRGAHGVLDAALEAVRPALSALDIAVDRREIHVTSLEEAQRESFVASPTIRVNGRDIQPEAWQSPCKECGELCNCQDGVDCRVWNWQGEQHLVPPLGLLVAAILSAVNEPDTAEPGASSRAVQEAGQRNLSRFFEAGSSSPECCPPSCCQ